MQRGNVEDAVFKAVAEPPTLDQLLLWMSANKNPCIAGLIDTAQGLAALLARKHKGRTRARAGTAPTKRRRP
jgi:hypothetical protein